MVVHKDKISGLSVAAQWWRLGNGCCLVDDRENQQSTRTSVKIQACCAVTSATGLFVLTVIAELATTARKNDRKRCNQQRKGYNQPSVCVGRVALVSATSVAMQCNSNSNKWWQGRARKAVNCARKRLQANVTSSAERRLPCSETAATSLQWQGGKVHKNGNAQWQHRQQLSLV